MIVPIILFSIGAIIIVGSITKIKIQTRTTTEPDRTAPSFLQRIFQWGPSKKTNAPTNDPSQTTKKIDIPVPTLLQSSTENKEDRLDIEQGPILPDAAIRPLVPTTLNIAKAEPSSGATAPLAPDVLDAERPPIPVMVLSTPKTEQDPPGHRTVTLPLFDGPDDQDAPPHKIVLTIPKPASPEPATGVDASVEPQAPSSPIKTVYLKPRAQETPAEITVEPRESAQGSADVPDSPTEPHDTPPLLPTGENAVPIVAVIPAAEAGAPSQPGFFVDGQVDIDKMLITNDRQAVAAWARNGENWIQYCLPLLEEELRSGNINETFYETKIFILLAQINQSLSADEASDLAQILGGSGNDTFRILGAILMVSRNPDLFYPIPTDDNNLYRYFRGLEMVAGQDLLEEHIKNIFPPELYNEALAQYGEAKRIREPHLDEHP